MKKLMLTLLLAVTFLNTGCGDSNSNGFNLDPIPIGNAPVARDDGPFSVDQGSVLTVPAPGVLENDSVNGALPDFPTQSAGGGTVAGNNNGGFTYTPPANFSGGADTFTYFLENSSGISTATVTITVNPADGYFVDAVNGSDASGDFNGGQPYQTIQRAVQDAPNGADIIVRSGNYSGAITLKPQQRLLGSGSGLIQAQGQTRPVLTGPVDLADGNTLDFLRIDGTNGDAADGSGQSGGTVTNCEFANTANNGNAFRGDNISGNWNLSNNVVSNTAGIAFFVTTTGTSTARLIADNNNITNAQGAMGFVSGGTSDIAASVKGNTFTSSAGVGSAFELSCTEDSTFCLDLENNTNDDVYDLFDDNLLGATAVLSVEQLNVLTSPQPGGAGNTGTVEDNTGVGGDMPTNVADGFCGF